MTKTAKPHLPLGKSMILGLLASGAVLGGTAFLPAGALAGDPAYVGKWAATLALCKNGQEMEIVAASRHDERLRMRATAPSNRSRSPSRREAGVLKSSARSRATSKPMTSSSP